MSLRSDCIVVVDDDPEVRSAMVSVLSDHGFAVLEAATGRQASKLVSREAPDLVLLDLGLPDTSGLDLLTQVVDEAGIPVVVVSGRSGEMDRVVGLEVGADDYITKPFSSRELVARVHAVLRRNRRSEPDPVLRRGELVVDARSRDVAVGDRAVALTAKEFDLLYFLAARAGQVFTRRQLLQHVWRSSPSWQDDSTVAEHVYRIRRKLDAERRERFIETVHGVGYRFARSTQDAPG